MTVSAAKSLPIGPHLKRDAAGLIKRGETGAEVSELQRALNAAGAHLAVDGDFGPKTESAVRDFQRRTNIAADGVVGPRTLQALQQFKTGGKPQPAPRPVPGSNPVDPSKSAEWNKYARIVKAHGGQVNPGGKPTVLGLRKGNGASSSYRDEFVVLLKNGQVKHFTGSTRPGQSSSSLSPDVNGDGVGDVAELRPGNYFAVPNGTHANAPSYSVRQAGMSGDRVAAYRDLNHDGFYSASEKDWSRRHGITATAILFHQGNSSSPSSIGCQNLTPSNVWSFIRSVGGSGGSFNYTLVDA